MNVAFDVLFKPSGVPVFALHNDPQSDCMLARLLADQPHRAQVPWPAGFEGGICHRLDIPTSGALLVAADPSSLLTIRRWFTNKELVKTYYFYTNKNPPWTRNQCSAPLVHHRKKRKRMIVERGQNTPHRGRWLTAHTDFEVMAPNLIKATMRTGVMHQIRAHAAFVGVALAGDKLYGGGPAKESEPSFLLHHSGMQTPIGHTPKVVTPSWLQLK